ncbi:hypothetical protein V1520DRAFT_343464 [Lipomyces starkeyi]|uniref:WSC domain-containing protein n=1 Tax=Lipomyces starkeyi NRRL Y-11557 TaxID=675824 RepID=A0A1E3PU39_LIPST|nr:hypothetical protein LIPSTDRAFT_76563 [Lipomyces starkeyi NRRL Y-11557]
MRRISPWSWCGLVVLLLAWPSLAANTFTFCSSQNTGSSYQAVYDIYQSYGACMSNCQSGYALAILQDFQCWCSNEAPGDTTSLSSCSVDSCPGYPSDPCGNLIEGLYGYILISPPSGTASASVASTTSSDSATKTSRSSHSSTSTASAEASSTEHTSTTSRLTTSSTSSSSFSSRSTSASTSASSTSSTTSSTSINAPTQSLIVSVVTVVGATETLVITQTVSTATPTASSSASSLATPNVGSSTTGTAESTSHSSSSFWDHKGKVAGTFVAVGIVALLLLLLLVFLVRRRHHRNDEEPGAGKAPHTPPMNDLPLAKYGLSGNGRHRSAATTGAGATTLDSEKHPSAVAAAGYGGAYSAPPPSSDRFQVDQRLDPGTMYVQYHDNYSRGSLRDEYDYSRRVLKILNPDDE